MHNTKGYMFKMTKKKEERERGEGKEDRSILSLPLFSLGMKSTDIQRSCLSKVNHIYFSLLNGARNSNIRIKPSKNTLIQAECEKVKKERMEISRTLWKVARKIPI